MDITKIRTMLSTALFLLAAKIAPTKKKRKPREKKQAPPPGEPRPFDGGGSNA